MEFEYLIDETDVFEEISDEEASNNNCSAEEVLSASVDEEGGSPLSHLSINKKHVHGHDHSEDLVFTNNLVSDLCGETTSNSTTLYEFRDY